VQQAHCNRAGSVGDDSLGRIGHSAQSMSIFMMTASLAVSPSSSLITRVMFTDSGCCRWPETPQQGKERHKDEHSFQPPARRALVVMFTDLGWCRWPVVPSREQGKAAYGRAEQGKVRQGKARQGEGVSTGPFLEAPRQCMGMTTCAYRSCFGLTLLW